MSILDVTEDQIFQTLGRGKDPKFKPIEKVRPVVTKPKKTYPVTRKAAPEVKAGQPVEPVIQPYTPPLQTGDPITKLTEDLNELNKRVAGLHKMVKWYILPQFIVVIVLILAILLKENS